MNETQFETTRDVRSRLLSADERTDDFRSVLHSLVEKSNDGVLILDRTGAILFSNTTASKIFTTPPDKGGFLDKLVLKPGRCELETDPGSEHNQTLELDIFESCWEDRDAYACIVRDITLHKRLERDLENASREWRVTFDAINDLISVHDPEGRLLRVNKALADFVGLPVQEIPGRICYEVIHKTACSVLGCPLENAVCQKKMCTAEIEDPASGRFFEITVSPIINKHDEVVSCVHIARDITEKNKMLQELELYSNRLEEMVDERSRRLNEARDELARKEKMAAIGQLAATVRHDLRNPLGVIKNSLYFIRAKMASNEDTKIERHLTLIDQQIDHCNAIIGELLDFSRDRKPILQEVDFMSFLEGVVAELQRPENVEIRLDITNDASAVHLDPLLMRRVLVNLCINAFHAMPLGGVLTITARAGEDWLSFEVADTGCGIEPDKREKIFEPLFTTKATGVGLGLASVRNIVARHGGTVVVTSEPSQGTAFKIRLPVEGSTQS